jgi:uncharacterized protein YdeI (YjbR/CyaY-like superfamily)
MIINTRDGEFSTPNEYITSPTEYDQRNYKIHVAVRHANAILAMQAQILAMQAQLQAMAEALSWVNVHMRDSMVLPEQICIKVEQALTAYNEFMKGVADAQ